MDPGGRAGLASDLTTFHDLGVEGVSVVTSLTAQNTRAVRQVRPVPPAFVTRQANVLLEEFSPDAVKVGMAGSAANLDAIARLIRAHGLCNVVLDPVMVSTSGTGLLSGAGAAALRRLLPLVRVVTPNLREAAALGGTEVTDTARMKRAAREIHALGARAVLVKGGHLEGLPVDLLYDNGAFHAFRAGRMRGDRAVFRGTGCILSAAIAASLAKGAPLELAVRQGRRYLRKVLASRGARGPSRRGAE